MLACVIVGGPGLLLVLRWVRRALERSGGVDRGWEVYLVVAELASLATAATGAYIWGESLTEGTFRITPAAVTVVWGFIWMLHHTLAGRRGRARPLALRGAARVRGRPGHRLSVRRPVRSRGAGPALRHRRRGNRDRRQCGTHPEFSGRSGDLGSCLAALLVVDRQGRRGDVSCGAPTC